MAATQEALYGELDLALSWSERELPERERTKHVHRLHPYLGKFVPQLVEALLERYVRPGGRVLDPFAGLRDDARAVARVGLRRGRRRHRRVQRAPDLRQDARARPRGARGDVRDVAGRLGASDEQPTGFVRDWFAPHAAAELLHFRSLIPEYAQP